MRILLYDEFMLLLARHHPDISVLTESWLSPEDTDDSIAVPGYLAYRKDRLIKRGGGILCFVRNSFSVTIIDLDPLLSPLSINSEFLSLHVKELSLVVIIIYHPYWNDSQADDEALTTLFAIIDHVYVRFGSDIRLALLGDFNDLRKHYSSISQLSQLSPIVDFPTRGTHTLDQLFVNFAIDQKPFSLPPLSNSDHCVILWEPSVPHSPLLLKKKVRNFSQSNMLNFSKSLCSYDWLSFIKSFDNLDTASTFFQESLLFLFNLYFPARCVRFKSDEPEWIKPSFKILVNDRDKAFHSGQRAKYNRLKKAVQDHLKFLKKDHLTTAATSKCPKKVWKSIRVIARCHKRSLSTNFSPQEFSKLLPLFSNLLELYLP